MARVFEMTSLRNHYQQVLPQAHQQHSSPASQILATAARRLWIPLLATFLGLSYILSTAPQRPGLKLSATGTGRSARAGAVLLDDPASVEWDRVSSPLELGTTVLDRLAEWEAAPRLEPADWVYKSTEFCPSYRISPNQNKQQLEQSHLLWSSLNSTVLYSELRDEMIAYLRKREKEGAMAEKAWGTGKGLVFTAGNSDTFMRVRTTLRMLKEHLGTSLPSEIFSFPGEEPDEEVRQQLLELGASFRVVESAVRDPRRTKNYHIKATSIIQSRFREVLYLDSDNIPTGSLMPRELVKDAESLTEWERPAGLWEAKAYERLGVMFWPDYWRTSADNPIWSVIGVPCRDEWEQEAGQILIDKSKHLDALLLSEWMMDSSRFKFWFNFSDGDKDMFRYSFLALRKRWGVPGRFVGAAALPRNTMSGFCGHTMLQHDQRGLPLFVHANLLKQITSGVGRGFAWGKTRSIFNPPTALQWPSGHEPDLPRDEELPDYDVDCDHLANAANDGFAIKRPAPIPVRRRAVLEKGLRGFFHGGWLSALCIDIRYEDSRSEDEQSWARQAALSVRDPDDEPIPEDAQIDISFTMAEDGMEMKFQDPLEIRDWADDSRLRGFEDAFFDVGGVLNAPGF